MIKGKKRLLENKVTNWLAGWCEVRPKTGKRKKPGAGQAFWGLQAGNNNNVLDYLAVEAALTIVISLATSGNVNRPPTTFTPFTRHSQV